MELMRKQLASNTPHTGSAVTVTQRASKSGDRAEIEWKFTDDEGRGWIGSAVAKPSSEEKGKFNLTLWLARNVKSASR